MDQFSSSDAGDFWVMGYARIESRVGVLAG